MEPGKRPDFVFIDMSQLADDNFRLLDFIRRRYSSLLPVFAVENRPDLTNRIRAFRHGITDVVAYPTELSTVESLFIRHLNPTA
jgi:CheY-like chemotaxis protein